MPGKGEESAMNYATVKRLLANQSQDELFKIIAKLSSRNDKAGSWLLEYSKNIKMEDDDEQEDNCSSGGSAGDSGRQCHLVKHHCFNCLPLEGKVAAEG